VNVTSTSAPSWRPRVLLALAALALVAILGVVLLSARDRSADVAPSPAPSVTQTPRGGSDVEPGTGDLDGAGALPDPADRGLGNLLVPAAGPFVSADLRATDNPPVAGVVVAFSGTFTNGRDIVALQALELDSPAAAAAAAAAAAPDGFTTQDARDAGDVGDPAVGTYVAYVRDSVGAIRWTNGPYLLELTGPWQQVRELYLAYPL
jgi:hypothetical protein